MPLTPCTGCNKNKSLLYGKRISSLTFSNREAEAKLKQLLDGHGLSNNNGGEGEGGNARRSRQGEGGNSRSRQGVVLGGAITRSLEQLPVASSRLLAASLDNLPGPRLPPRPASAVRRQLFTTKDGVEGREARLRSRCLQKLVLESGQFDIFPMLLRFLILFVQIIYLIFKS